MLQRQDCKRDGEKADEEGGIELENEKTMSEPYEERYKESERGGTWPFLRETEQQSRYAYPRSLPN